MITVPAPRPPGPSPARARRRLTGLVLAASAALFGGTGCGSTSWAEDTTAIADAAATAAGTEHRAADPAVTGNALCLDVCRQLNVTYDVDMTAEETTRTAVAGMHAAGFTFVTSDCTSNPWCTVTAEHGRYALTLSQYRENAPYDLPERRVLTITVGDADS